MSSLQSLRASLRSYANPEKAKFLQRFFKTGTGEYAEGDVFLGVVVPDTRKVSRQFRELPLGDLQKLLQSRIHEERLCALLILVQAYKAKPEQREEIFRLYLANTANINNWDLVDLSAPNIVGAHLLDKDTGLLKKLAGSALLWDRRIAILATAAFIRTGRFEETIRLSEQLLHDDHDLIHKAVGWMLREVGKRDSAVLEQFLQKHAEGMPRTMLRNAIEKFPEAKRKAYLQKP